MRVRYKAYEHAEVYVYDTASLETGVPLGDPGTAFAACAHCRQRYRFEQFPRGGFRCTCCDDVTPGLFDCARCGRTVIPEVIDEPAE